MAHTTEEVCKSRVDLEICVKREIEIHRAYIGALENTIRAMQMVSSVDLNGKAMPLPAGGKLKALAERLTG